LAQPALHLKEHEFFADAPAALTSPENRPVPVVGRRFYRPPTMPPPEGR